MDGFGVFPPKKNSHGDQPKKSPKNPGMRRQKKSQKNPGFVPKVPILECFKGDKIPIFFSGFRLHPKFFLILPKSRKKPPNPPKFFWGGGRGNRNSRLRFRCRPEMEEILGIFAPGFFSQHEENSVGYYGMLGIVGNSVEKIFFLGIRRRSR